LDYSSRPEHNGEAGTVPGISKMKHFLWVILLSLTACTSPPQIKLPSRTVSFDLIYTITPKQSHPASVELTSLIPVTIPDRQTIHSVKYSVKPIKIFNNDGNMYARFFLSEFTGKTNIFITVKATISHYDLATAIKQPSKSKLSKEEKYRFTRSEKYIEVSDLLIQETAKRLKKNSSLETVRSCFNFVSKKLTYAGYIHNDMGAIEALQMKRADCDGYTSLFTALVRACGIPVKYVEGITVDYNSYPHHGWAEVFISKLGWIPLDPTYGNFDKRDNEYIHFTYTRSDNNLFGYHFYMCRHIGNRIKTDDYINFHNK
jgi:transglutaminase/protease-like cytokinesis protein 3